MTAVDSRLSAAATSARAHRPRRTARQAVSGYVALTKPRIIELLLVTTVPTMFLAEGGIPSLWLVAATLIGGSMAAGSANTLNCYLDRDIDMVMHRTERRPLATGLVSPREALAFGTLLGVASVAWLFGTVGWLAAALAFVAIAFYVGVYTMALKRRTPQNIVWGGAAGCMPVLIGWAAVTGSLSWTPLVLFAIIFFWTPPHYWPLSLRFRDDYAAAGVPMLPVVADVVVVARRIVAYSWVMVAVSLLLWPVAHTGPVYAVSALVLGAAFLIEAHRLLGRARKVSASLVGTEATRPASAGLGAAGLGAERAGGLGSLGHAVVEPAVGSTGAGAGAALSGASLAAIAPMRLFHWSITYLSLLFVAIAIDPLLHF